jgi:subtilisin family serine protease
MEGVAVRRRNLLIAAVLLVATAAVGTTAGARPAPSVSRLAAGSDVRSGAALRFPWRSGVARIVPNQVVVVWRGRASSANERAVTARVGATRVSPAPGLGVDVVWVPSDRSVGAAIRAFRRSPLVRFAEPNRIADPAGTPPPNDTFFAEQWALDNTGQDHPLTAYPRRFPYGETGQGTAGADVDARAAWTSGQTGDPSVVIAVLDTGVDINHPDLVNRVVPGKDFVGNDDDPTPGDGLENSHGTHVSGIVAAEQGNATGISGVCPDCRVMPIRIGTKNGLTLANELKGIDFAIANGADVINMSFTSPIWSKAERAAIAKAGRNDILVVVAAGNSSMDNDIEFYDHLGDNPPAYAPAFPATYTLSNIISVAATTDRDQYAYVSQCRGTGIPKYLCGFTSWGHDSADVAAPGVDIISTVKQGQEPPKGIAPDYHVWDGTSMAAPMVAGIAGLVRSEEPTWSAVQVKNAIMHSVNHPSSLQLYTEWANETHVGKKLLSGRFTRTNGRVNADAALTGLTSNATPRTDGNIDGARSIKAKRTGSIKWPVDDNDVFKRRLVQGNTYRIVLNGPKGKDLDLWVWRPKTKEIFQFTASCFSSPSCPSFQAASARPGTADELVRFKAPKTGVFYIQVNGWYSGGSYTLTVKKL